MDKEHRCVYPHVEHKQKDLIRKIIISVLFFICGFAIAFFTESFFRGIIQDLYRWTTNDNIEFFGKNFYLFGSPKFHFGFAISFTAFYLTNNIEIRTIKNVALGIGIFALSVVGLSAIDANMKIIECTACDDGVRRLHWNDINYGLILGLSSIFSVVPSVVLRILKNKASAQQSL